MGRKIIYYCDKCGKEIDSSKHGFTIGSGLMGAGPTREPGGNPPVALLTSGTYCWDCALRFTGAIYTK